MMGPTPINSTSSIVWGLVSKISRRKPGTGRMRELCYSRKTFKILKQHRNCNAMWSVQSPESTQAVVASSIFAKKFTVAIYIAVYARRAY
mmetsp:Transcript_25423/g.61237  ORF Transcript_25423/g.61237 Transcript_25423/m.61237 type:complete len:90 (-) Transcript_25423:121-390(-)